jgi:four helix bundle protein
MSKSIVKERSYAFALRIVGFCAQLKNDRHFEISNQLLRAGTSIGANVEEALAGTSRKDFFFKMTIASKEARETRYWLHLIRDAALFDGQQVNELISDCHELVLMLTSIVKTGSERGKARSELKT